MDELPPSSRFRSDLGPAVTFTVFALLGITLLTGRLAGFIDRDEDWLKDVIKVSFGVALFLPLAVWSWWAYLFPRQARRLRLCLKRRKRSRPFKTLPPDIAERVAALGEYPAFYRRMLTEDGEKRCRGFLKKVEESASLFREWFPRLKELERKCREQTPLPDVADFTPEERAQYAVYQQKIRAAEIIFRGPNCVTFFSSTPVGLVAAKELWPGEREPAVFLTPDEASQWRAIYEHDENKFWWFMSYSWIIEKIPFPVDAEDLEVAEPVPPNAQWWAVTKGLIWGPLAGGIKTEHWVFDGEKARFVRFGNDIQF